MPGQVGHHHERALEDPHQDQAVLAAVVGADLVAEPADAVLDLLGGDHDLVDVVLVLGHVGRKCRNGEIDPRVRGKDHCASVHRTPLLGQR